MALKFGELFVDIGADTSGLNRADREVKRTTQGMSKSFMSLGRVIAGVLTGIVVKNTILLADKMNMLDQQLKNVAKNAASFNKIRDGVRGIAAETGNSIESVTRLTQALIIAGESIGATDDQVIEMTSNLNKLGVIGGSSGEAMGNALRQFGQAMAGGIVRAEEFNSIVENTPLIAKSIADGMNVTTGELRKMVIEGKVLSEEVFRSLQSQTQDINDKFAAMPLTVDRASGMIANSFGTALQELDNGLGVTEDIAASMKELADTIGQDVVPFIDGMIDGLIEFLDIFDELTASTQDLANDTFDLAASWKLVTDFFTFFANAVINLPSNIRDMTTVLVGEFDKAWLKVTSGFETVTALIEFGLESAFKTAITKVRVIWNDFISFGQRGLANLFAIFGENKISESIRRTANETAQTGENLNNVLAEQQAIREEQLAAEIIAIDANLAAKVNAANVAIDMGLAETESLKRQAAERTKVRQRERADRRKGETEVAKESEKVVKVLEKSNAEKLKDMKAYGAAANTLAQAGIISDKANALIQIGISAATAVAKTSELGFPQALPFIAMALANIANAKQMLSGSGRQFGGTATGGLPIPVNENGPEMFTNNAGRQFLLPDQSGNITPLGKGGGGTGGVKVIINNNAAGVEVTQTMSDDAIMFMIEKAEKNAINAVNSSLASGRGETFDALQQSTTQTRNI